MYCMLCLTNLMDEGTVEGLEHDRILWVLVLRKSFINQ